jgi:hypothetical protein
MTLCSFPKFLIPLNTPLFGNNSLYIATTFKLSGYQFIFCPKARHPFSEPVGSAKISPASTF